MVDGVLGVVLGDGILPVHDLQLGALLEWVLLKTQQVQDAAQRLDGHTHTHTAY